VSVRHLAFLLIIAFPLAALAQDDPLEKRTREGDAGIEAAVRAALARVKPAIVEVETLGAMPEKVETPHADENAPGGTQDGVLAKKGFKQAFGPSTGVAVGKELVITSMFALKREPRHIFVTRGDGKSFVATVLGKDEARMIALLKVPGAELTPAPEAASASIKVGATALSIGRGYGTDTPTVSQGIVSGVGRQSGRAIQTDANVSPGCYGGPLVSIDGEVMGLVVPLAGMGGMAGVELYDSGIGFAIPMEDIRKLLPRLEKGETLKAGMLGITADMGRTEEGVEVETIQPDSTAAKMGLRPKDVIVEIDGKPIKGIGQLSQAIGRHVAGDKVKLVVERNGASSEYEGDLGEYVRESMLKDANPQRPGPGRPPGPPPPGGQPQ
jgi:serine protease Do